MRTFDFLLGAAFAIALVTFVEEVSRYSYHKGYHDANSRRESSVTNDKPLFNGGEEKSSE